MNIKPTLRDITRIDVLAYIEGIRRIITDQRQFPFCNCINCRHFKEEIELCNLANSRPPASVIAYGCPSHEDIEEIPF